MLISELKQRIGECDLVNQILSYALGCSVGDIYLRDEIDDIIAKIVIRAVKKHRRGIPLQYIFETAHFYGHAFHVNKHVLIPRNDTEILVETVLKRLKPNSRVLDMCTGSGCIAVTIKAERPDTEVTASDISKKALSIAQFNSEMILEDVCIEFIRGDLFENINGQFDCIVCNPPYIRTKEIGIEDKSIKREPKRALDGGDDGLIFYFRLSWIAREYLKDDGFLALEIGHDQGNDVRELLLDAGWDNIEVIKDLAGRDRVVIAKKVQK